MAVRFIAAGTCARIVLAPVVMALVLAGAGFRGPGRAAVRVRRRDGLLGRAPRAPLEPDDDARVVPRHDRGQAARAGVLIALLGVDRVSPWIAAIIIGREFIILGLRGVVAVDGEVMAPSIWGKLKTTIQFVAILLAILRPGSPIGGLYLDEWVMLIAAAVTVMSAVDYLQRFASSLTGRA